MAKKVQEKSCVKCGKLYDPSKTKCPHCKSWNWGDVPGEPANLVPKEGYENDGTILLSRVKSAAHDRVATRFAQNLFGYNKLPDGSTISGIVRTSLNLIGGEPGAGKSTLLLQILGSISFALNLESLYIAAEEAESEIKLRADRLEVPGTDFIRIVPALGGLPRLGEILQTRKPCAVVLDSLVGLVGDDSALAGEVLKDLKLQAVSLKAPIVVIQQVNKSLDIAGRMSEQHAVDATFLFTSHSEEARELECMKNRFGAAHCSQWFAMTPKGLIEIAEPDLSEEEEEEEEERPRGRGRRRG